MAKKLILILLLISGYIIFSKNVYALDAENAHPWIAENAAKIWPYDGDFSNPCKEEFKQACTEFSQYLGAYNSSKEVKSGTFQDNCNAVILNPKETYPAFACTGKNIVEGSIEEDYNPWAGITALGHRLKT